MVPLPTLLASDLSSKQSKYKKNFLGLVMLNGPALDHTAAPMLMEFATAGWDTTINMQWSMEMIEAAITRGAHLLAQLPEPAAQLQSKTLENVKQGYVCLFTWDSIKDNPPPN